MSGKPSIIRPVKLTTTIPEDIRARLDLHLYSDVEGRIPKGAYQDFLCARIREFFAGAWQRNRLERAESLLARVSADLESGDLAYYRGGNPLSADLLEFLNAAKP